MAQITSSYSGYHVHASRVQNNNSKLVVRSNGRGIPPSNKRVWCWRLRLWIKLDIRRPFIELAESIFWNKLDRHNFGSIQVINKRSTAFILSFNALLKRTIKLLSKISFHIQFK